MKNTRTYNYEFGFRMRENLDTDFTKSRKILNEHMNAEEESLVSLLNYAENQVQQIANTNKYDNFKKDKLDLINYLTKIHVSNNNAEKEFSEKRIQRILSKYKDNTRNILATWLKNQRLEFAKRQDKIL